jgi:hypothetical protein
MCMAPAIGIPLHASASGSVMPLAFRTHDPRVAPNKPKYEQWVVGRVQRRLRRCRA